MTESADRAVQSKGQKTRDAILDAAEELFGQGNFDSVSLRDIAHKANVLLGVIGYHFKGKEALFEAVATRRSDVINRTRLDQLRGYEKPSVEQILEAFIQPGIVMLRRPEWRNYMNIVAQISNEERWSGVNRRLFTKTAQEFYGALVRALPDSSPELVGRGFVYAVSVLLGVMKGDHARLKELSNNAYDTGDMTKILETSVPFVAAGLKALAAMDVSVPGVSRPDRRADEALSDLAAWAPASSHDDPSCAEQSG